MPALLWRNTWRYHLQHRWQTLLSIVGITLGVMMVVAVDLASNSARRAFDLSVEAVSGSLTHQIVGGSQGVPDALFTSVRNDWGIRRSAPSLSGELRVQGRLVRVLGLDLISEASLQRQLPGLDSDTLALTSLTAAAISMRGAVLMPAGLADSLGLESGSSFRLDPPHAAETLNLAGILEGQDAGASLLVMDIALAQELLGRLGRLDSIDLILDDAEAEALAQRLPNGLSLVEQGSRHASLEQMTEAFHVNLLAMSLLALLVAALLIYNTVSLSVMERRASFGVLRSLGTTRRELVTLLLAESALLGTLASALGVVVGIWLGSLLVEGVTRTIDDLYFTLSVSRFLVEPLLLLKGFCWGLGLSLLAALLPAWQAGRSPPVTLQQRGQDGLAIQRRLPAFSLLAVLLLAGGWWVLQSGGDLVRGFVALFMLVFGFCLLVPLLLHWVLQVLLRLAASARGFRLRLALRAIESGLDRTALAVAALTVAVSVTVGVGVMVNSLRDSVLLWLDQSLQGDVQLLILDPDADRARIHSHLAQHDGIAEYQPGWQFEVESSLGPLRVQAAGGAPDDWLYLKEGAVGGADAVLIAEPMASLLDLQPGEYFSLHTATGNRSLRVSGIFHDYSTGTPLIALTRQQLQAFWPAALPVRMSLMLEPDLDAQTFAASLRQELEALELPVLVTANRSIREETLRIFDRTFAITHVLRLLAVLVAFVGVFGAMLALQLQQLRNFAVLRAAGMTIREVAGLIAWQSLVLGTLAGLLALPLGLLMSEVLIEVINMRSFGWSMQHSVPPGILFEALGLALFAALLAG
ncbi:MAG TPA: FtsX-like permease family protein, partial [Pseudomonadaceae bacterium]|nr:FtsX-like permease family protein [Pseudomonadaceae bacterium]